MDEFNINSVSRRNVRNTGELKVAKNETLANSNKEIGLIFEGENSFASPNVDRLEQEYLGLHEKTILNRSTQYQDNVKTQNIIEAMFDAQDLSETNNANSHKQAGEILNQVHKAVKEAKTFDDVHIYDTSSYWDSDTKSSDFGKFKLHDADKLELKNKLSEEETEKYLNSDKGKEFLKEIGIETTTNKKGENIYKLNGNKASILMSEDGTLRVSYKYKASSGRSLMGFQFLDKDNTRIADFKLNDSNFQQKEEKEIKDKGNNENKQLYPKVGLDNNEDTQRVKEIAKLQGDERYYDYNKQTWVYTETDKPVSSS